MASLKEQLEDARAGAPPKADEAEEKPLPLVLLKDCPKFGKYFKMLAMHLPRPAVEMKMRAEGADVEVGKHSAARLRCGVLRLCCGV